MRDTPDKGPDEGEAIRNLFDQAAKAEWEGFDSPGEGRDYRLGAVTLTGSSLVFDEKLPLHVQLFGAEPGQGDRVGRERVRRPRIHRRYGPRRQSDVD